MEPALELRLVGEHGDAEKVGCDAEEHGAHVELGDQVVDLELEEFARVQRGV